MSWRKFTNIVQLTEKNLRLSFETMHIWQYYEKLDRLSYRRHEDILHRQSSGFDDIIETERKFLINFAISKIDRRFSTSFCQGLLIRIQRMMRNENKPLEKPSEIFEAAIKATRQLEVRHANELDRDYSFRHKVPDEVPYYETDAACSYTYDVHEASRDRPRRNDRDRQKGHNRRESGVEVTRRLQWGRNSKWCHYCKKPGHKIEQCISANITMRETIFWGELKETVGQVLGESERLTSGKCNRKSE